MLPTLPLYVSQLGGNQQEVGFVMGAFAIGMLLARPQLGIWADRVSRKWVLMLGMGVAMLAPLGYVLIEDIPILFGLRAFHGISIAAFATAYSALVVDFADPKRRGEIIGHMSLVNPLGMALGPMLGGWLYDAYGYSELFLVAAGLGMIGLGWILPLADPKLSVTPHAHSAPTKFWAYLQEPRMQIPFAVFLAIGMTFGTLATFMPLLVKQDLPNFNPGLFYTAAAASSFAMRLLIGAASDRWGRGVFISLSLVCYGLSMVLLWQATTADAILWSGVLEGCGGGLAIPMLSALLADRSAADERARVFGMGMGGFDVGISIAGPLLGTFTAFIPLRTVFVMAAVLCLLALILFMTCIGRSPKRSLRFALGRGGDDYALGEAS